jgi:hypothetical protein
MSNGSDGTSPLPALCRSGVRQSQPRSSRSPAQGGVSDSPESLQIKGRMPAWPFMIVASRNLKQPKPL